MSGRHGSQRKKKKKPYETHLPVVNSALSQEHPDSGKESGEMENTKDNPKRSWLVAIVMIEKVDYWNPHDYTNSKKVAFIQRYGNINQGGHTANYPPVFWRYLSPQGPVVKLPDDSDVKDLTSGKSFIQIWGEIDYRDVFGQDHWTKFCDWRALGPIGFPSVRERLTKLSRDGK